MYERGIECLHLLSDARGMASFWNDGSRIRRHLIAGFNFPVSVHHLHMHMVLPPLDHTNAFRFPRFHWYERVVRDVLTNDGVQLQTSAKEQEQQGVEDSMWRERVHANNVHVRHLQTKGPVIPHSYRNVGQSLDDM
jgi:hypothetical protein